MGSGKDYNVTYVIDSGAWVSPLCAAARNSFSYVTAANMERIFHDLDIIDPPSQRAEQVEALLKRFAKTWKMNATDAKA